MTINFDCGIYQVRNIITSVCYVGQSIDLKDRERHHWSKLKNNKHRNRYLQRSYNKRGKESFIFEILLYCESEELTYYEQFFVDKYVALDLSYNICRECVDSCKGIKRTEETCKKISESRKGITFTKKHKKNLSLSHTGENNSRYGKKHSSKTIKLMSGENNSMYNKHHSPASIELMRKNRSGVCKKDNPHTIKKEIVLQIVKALSENILQKDIVKILGVSRSTVYRTKKGYYDDIYDL